jgi:uncharacterized membrane protein YgaE (UPF0421/DUF939 family)
MNINKMLFLYDSAIFFGAFAVIISIIAILFRWHAIIISSVTILIWIILLKENENK